MYLLSRNKIKGRDRARDRADPLDPSLKGLVIFFEKKLQKQGV